jgi:hypothetical protein
VTAPDIEAVEAQRAALWRNGFHPVPLLNWDHQDKAKAGKAPLGNDWPRTAMQDPPECIRLGAVPHALNTGIMTGAVIAIDEDVNDPELAAEVDAAVVRHLGDAPMRYRDNSPRRARLYRVAEGELGSRRLVSRSGKGKVEMLGRAHQLASFGKHVSGVELRWTVSPATEITFADLPVITEAQPDALFADLAPIIDAELPSQSGSLPASAGLEPEASIERIAALLADIPNDRPADWEAWNRVLMAIWRASGGSPAGLALAVEWTERNPYCGTQDRAAARREKRTGKPDFCAARWRYFAKSPPSWVGVQTLMGMADDARRRMLEGLEGHGPGNGGTGPASEPAGSSKWDTRPDDTPDPLIAPTQPQALYPLPDACPFFRDTTRAVAGASEAAISLAGCVTLATMANAVARIVEKIEISPGLNYALSLYVAAIVGSSERKTTCERYTFASANEFISDKLTPVYLQALAEYRADLAIYEADKRDILTRRSQSKKAAKDDGFGFDDAGADRKHALMQLTEPVEPRSPRLITNDFTAEGLRKRVNETGGMVAVVTSEGAAVFHGYTFGDKNRRAAGAGILSRYWDGDDEDAARAGGSTNNKKPRVILCLGVQPRIASTFFADLDLRDQGIVNRFLITWPPSKAGTRQLEFPTQVDLATIRRFNDQAAACLRVAHGLDPRATDAPVVIAVTGAARQAWHDFAVRTERRQAKGQPYEAISGYAGKAAEEAARIAAIFTLFANPNADVVELDAMQAGIALADWHCGEWLRICDLVEPDPEMKLAVRLFEWLKEHYQPKDSFTARDVYTGKACGITTRGPADRLLKVLETHGLVVTSDPPKPRTRGRPPLVSWRLGGGNERV